MYEVKDGKVFVTVGAVEHPMTEAHYIEWVSMQTTGGNQRKALKPGDAPKVTFALLEGEEVEFQTLIPSYSITADNIDEFDLDAWDAIEEE